MHFSNKKSYCELCRNNACSDLGKRNIHFMANNLCSRFLTEEKPTVDSVLPILEKVSKNNLPLYNDIDKEIPRFIQAYWATDDSFEKFSQEFAKAIRILLHNYGLSRKIFSFDTITPGGVPQMNVSGNYWAINKKGNAEEYFYRVCPVSLEEFSYRKEIILEDKDINNPSPTLLNYVLFSLLRPFFYRDNDLVLQLLETIEPICFDNQHITPNLLKNAKKRIPKGCSLIDTKLVAGKEVLRLLLNNKDFKWEINSKEEIEKGNIGRLIDMDVITDAHLQNNLSCLNPNSFYITNNPGVIIEQKCATAIVGKPTTGQARAIFIDSIQAMGLFGTNNYYSAIIT